MVVLMLSIVIESGSSGVILYVRCLVYVLLVKRWKNRISLVIGRLMIWF